MEQRLRRHLAPDLPGILRRLLRLPPHIPILASVRIRLALWYLGITACVLLAFGGNLYFTETSLTTGAGDAQLETPLNQDAQRMSAIYGGALLKEQSPTAQHITLASDEIVLLLRPDGTPLDSRGPLTNRAIQQLQTQATNSAPIINLSLPLAGASSHHRTYRLMIVPILNQNMRVATLLVGLPREGRVNPWHLWITWVMRAIGIAVVSTLVGYWLASMAIRPVQQITQMANEITATDLRRRLHLPRRDEFGALAATFDQMLARLEAAFKRQSQFTADASHELRTPLTIMSLDINRALTQEQTPDGYRQILEQIQDENAHMAEIVNNLLLLARADTGQIALHQETVDLADIALECIERLMPLARQQQVTLATGTLPEILVAGDRHYLSRMVTNLVENGIKYTSGIGTRVTVEVSAGQGDRWAVLRVQDDGPGIADEHLPYLFDRFYRGDKARARRQTRSSGDEPGGAGLGLAIVQWIVQAHGGEVRVTSAIGAGTTFEVLLPMGQNLHYNFAKTPAAHGSE
jgi:heavy metal sensor kinase